MITDIKAMDDPPPPAPENSIPFSYSHHKNPVRLLELPPALLNLLTSPTPPPIVIKAATSPADAHPSAQEYNAVLCTPTQTFTLRQVYSSNTIFLTLPDASGGITTTSEVNSHLELLPCKPSVVPLLAPHIRAYTGWDSCDEEKAPPSDEPPKTRSWLKSEIPASDAEFDAAWNDVMAFEHAGECWRPNAGVLVRLLVAMWTGAIAAGVRLQGSFGVEEIMAGLDEEERVPQALVEALVARVCDDVNGRWRIERERCARLTGRWLLEAWTTTSTSTSTGTGGGEERKDMMYISFMSKWKAALPDTCTSLCKLDLIKDCHMLPTANTIRYVQPSENSSKGVEATKSTSTLPVRNKWHEKFRKGKKA